VQNKLNYATVLGEGLAYGLKNIPSLLGAIILWIITIWIPYVNVGTTIAISTLPLQLSRGKVFSPLAIFDKKYYRYMGEFFMTYGLMLIGLIGAAIFLYIPAIVVALAWSLSILILLDKGVNAAEAIRLSNKLTYGNKWTIFFVNITIGVAVYIVAIIFSFLLGALITLLSDIAFLSVLMTGILGILFLALIVVAIAVTIGCQAAIYGTLSKNIEDQN
jgi:hypothetical protein